MSRLKDTQAASRVAILMSVFNRREKTLACLSACFAQVESLRPCGNYEFSVWLTEDGCTDGTSEAVASAYPSVNIIHGDGNLYWNRGMCAAWEQAAVSDPDFYIWINDDTVPVQGAFSVLFDTSSALGDKAIVAATAVGSDGSLSYGGRNRKGRIIRPDDTIPVWCAFFNGNLVLVPRHVYRKIGALDSFYFHVFGDFDYGVRAAKAGITSVVAPGILAKCDRNAGIPAWRDASFSLRERYAAITSPKGRPFKEQFVYDLRSEGILKALTHFVTLNLRVLFPKRRS